MTNIEMIEREVLKPLADEAGLDLSTLDVSTRRTLLAKQLEINRLRLDYVERNAQLHQELGELVVAAIGH
jgi:hypothetical protein